MTAIDDVTSKPHQREANGILVQKAWLSIVCDMANGSRPERQVCALCGCLYIAIHPAGWSRHGDDKLCGACLMLPKPPVAPYERRDTEDTAA